jgi:hypothetical protein
MMKEKYLMGAGPKSPNNKGARGALDLQNKLN